MITELRFESGAQVAAGDVLAQQYVDDERAQLAAPGAIVLPAMIGAGQTTIDDFAFAQRTAAVDAGVGKYMCLTIGITKGDELQSENLRSLRLVSQVCGDTNGIPEIYIHRQVNLFGLKP